MSKKLVFKPNINKIIVGENIKGIILCIDILRWKEFFRNKHDDESNSNLDNLDELDELSIDSENSNSSRKHNCNKLE